MNNIIITVKRFFQNKNAITILGVIAIITILYFSYNSQIENQVKPIRRIPCANQIIQPRTLITEDMITYVDIPQILNQENVLLNSNFVIGKYTNHNTVIPKGSLFYMDVLINKEDLPDAAFEKIKEGEVVVKMPVDMTSTFGNSIFPGNKVDIYMKAETEERQIMVGKLFENIEIIDVKDSAGRHVFENTVDSRTPSLLIFGLKPELNILLLKASYLRSRSVEVFPVPHGGLVVQAGETQVSSKNLKDFINAYSIPNDEVIEQIEKTNIENDMNLEEG